MRATLDRLGATYTEFSEEELVRETAAAIDEGRVVGWMQGRMEFGPRALGSRSILGDPRSSSMQSTMNLKIKYRESFRPFAPSVLKERASQWFDLREEHESPYMTLVAAVRDEHRVDVEQEKEGFEKLKVRRSACYFQEL